MPEYKTVVMTKTHPGSADGIKINTYEKGKKYDLPVSLATAFIKHLKCAKPAKREEEKAADEPKPNETPEQGSKELETPEKPKQAEKPEEPKKTTKKTTKKTAKK